MTPSGISQLVRTKRLFDKITGIRSQCRLPQENSNPAQSCPNSRESNFSKFQLHVIAVLVGLYELPAPHTLQTLMMMTKHDADDDPLLIGDDGDSEFDNDIFKLRLR